MKKTLVALLILAMLLSLAACSTTKQTPEAATPSTDNSAAEQTETKDESSEKIWKVGIALQVSGDHQANIVNALKEGLDKESNIQYEVVDHEANVTKEISQIEDFMQRRWTSSA
jgi:ABC-type sugar transport system substrate-binding protein